MHHVGSTRKLFVILFFLLFFCCHGNRVLHDVINTCPNNALPQHFSVERRCIFFGPFAGKRSATHKVRVMAHSDFSPRLAYFSIVFAHAQSRGMLCFPAYQSVYYSAVGKQIPTETFAHVSCETSGDRNFCPQTYGSPVTSHAPLQVIVIQIHEPQP